MEQKKRRNIIIFIIIIAAVLILYSVYGADSCNLGGTNYEVLSEDISFTYYSSTASPKVTVKIKNTSKRTLKMSFNGNIYCDGELFTSVISNVLTLESGDTGTFTAVTIKETYIFMISTQSWTFKITKWNNYRV